MTTSLVNEYSRFLFGGSTIVHTSKKIDTMALIPKTAPNNVFRVNTMRRNCRAAPINRFTAATFTINGTNSRVYPKLINHIAVAQDAVLGGNPTMIAPNPINNDPASNKCRNSVCAIRMEWTARRRYTIIQVMITTTVVIPPNIVEMYTIGVLRPPFVPWSRLLRMVRG